MNQRRLRSSSPLATRVRDLGAYAGPDTIAAMRRYRTGLGSLGDSTVTATGQIVSKGVSIGAGAAATAAIAAGVTAIGGAAAGAALGSVVPIVGTVIGAAVGYLTSKLFGHADYAAVYANANNVSQLFQAYETVAGSVPGRVYGWPEIQYVWHGAMIYGIFRGNGPSVPGSCTQGMIASNINACGNGTWLDDWIGAGAPKPGSGSNNIVNLVGTALAAGLRDPRQIVAQYVVPGAEAVSKGKNNGWISVAGSTNPQMYTQMLIDLVDVIVTTAYPQTPVYYGVAPPGFAGSVSVTPATPTPQGNASGPATQVQVAQAQPVSQPGASIKAGGGGSLTTAQGTWTFGPQTGSGGYLPMLNGAQAGNSYGVLLTLNSDGTLTLTNDSNSTAKWNGQGWVAVTTGNTQSVPAQAAQTTAALSPAGTTITPASGGSIVSGAGTWTFGGSNDGSGNYQVLLNGNYASAGNSNAAQLQVNTSGVVVATISNGATYGWTSNGWTSISGPTTVTAAPAPVSVSTNGTTIIPGGGSQLVTAQGDWTFSNQSDGTGNYYVDLNGSLAGSETGIQLTILNSVPSLLRNDGSVYAWNGSAWVQTSGPTTATASAPGSLLSPTAPDGGLDLSSPVYTGGGQTYAPDPTSDAAPVTTVPVTNDNEKILLWGGAGLAVMAVIFAMTRHGGRR